MKHVDRQHRELLLKAWGRRFPPPWTSIIRLARDDSVVPAFRRRCFSQGPHQPSKQRLRLAYCLGGIGVRDDGGAIGARDDGGTGVRLGSGAPIGRAGGSGIFTISSATADSSLFISRPIWS